MSFNAPVAPSLQKIFEQVIARRDTRRVLELWVRQHDNGAVALERRNVEREMRERLGAGVDLRRVDQLFDGLVRQANGK